MPNKAERDAWKEKLVNDAEQKILELTDSDKFKDYLNTLSKFHGYSQRNVDFIFAQDPTATQVAGFKQWQTDFNRHVNKGAKSIRISAPIIKKLSEEDKKRLDTTEDKAIVGYRFIPIFDIKQTSGDPVLSAKDFVKENLQEHKNVTDLYNSFKNYLNDKTNLSVSEDNITQPGVKGYFVPRTNEIVIDNKEQDSALMLKTLYHEYAHSQLHGLTSEFKDRPREYKETQAEAVAYVAMQNIGVDTSDYSLGYVATWAKDKDLIHKAISEIQKVSNKTIDLTAELTKKLQLDQKQENTKTINNKFNLGQEAKPQQPNLSEQYKTLHGKLKEPGTNKQQTQEQLNKVRTEISQKTQQQLKDFAKANPDLKQPRVKKEQQTLQR